MLCFAQEVINMTGAIFGWFKIPIKRIKFALKLKRICRRKGFTLETEGFFWMFGSNGNGKCNFTVKTEKERLQVKLVGVRSRRVYFGFVDGERYEIRDMTFADIANMNGIRYEYRSKSPYRFEEGAKPFIVMTPISNIVTARLCNGKRREIGNGDHIPEGRFYFSRGFLALLEEQY